MVVAMENEDLSTIILPNPLKDAAALTIIFYKLPPSLNCLVLVLYALSGSSRAIAGKLLAKILKQINHKRSSLGSGDSDISDINDIMNNDHSAQTPDNNDEKTLTYFELLSYVINSGVVPLMIHFVISISIFYCSPNLLSLFTILSKAMVSSSLFGIHGTKALVTSIMISFGIVAAVKCYSFLIQTSLSTNSSTSAFINAIAQVNSLDSKLESQFFKLAYDYNIFNLLNLDQSFSYFFTNFFNSFWNFLNYTLSIHVILLEISPNFKDTTYIKSYIRSLDQLAKISPEYIPDELTTDIDPEPIEDHSNFATVNYNSKQLLTFHISDELSELKLNQIADSSITSDPNNSGESALISNDDNFSDSPASFPADVLQEVFYSNSLSSSLSTVISNLETFCKIPFMWTVSSISSTALTTAATTAVNSLGKKPSTKKLYDVRYQQPLWSIVAALYAMRKRPDIYSGELSISDAINETNNENSLVPLQQGRYNNFLFPDHNYPVKCFIDYVGQTSIAFQVIQLTKRNGKQNNSWIREIDIIVLVNGIEWNTHTYNDEYIVIIGLTPCSTYDIEIFGVSNNAEALISKYIVCTLSDTKDHKFNSSKIESPLETLKKSVTTTKNSVVRERLKLKKLKKDNSKAIADLMKEIELLSKKIRESDKNDEKLWKKVAALKIETKQLEDEILKKKSQMELKKTSTKDILDTYNKQKTHYQKQYVIYKQSKQTFEQELDALKQKKHQLYMELDTITQKNEKLKTRLVKYQTDQQKTEQECHALIENYIRQRKTDREKRLLKRISLISEFKSEIHKVLEMTRINQERVESLEKEELQSS